MVALYDRPYANKVIECEVEHGYDEPRVRQVETTSKGNDEQLEEDLNSLCALKQLMGDLSKEEPFHARYKIKDKVCFFVIDYWSNANVVSCTMVDE